MNLSLLSLQGPSGGGVLPQGGGRRLLGAPPDDGDSIPAGFYLDDPAGVFSGLARENGDGLLAFLHLDLVSSGTDCVHETPGTRTFTLQIIPADLSYVDIADRLETTGFADNGDGTYTLSVANDPRSVATGTLTYVSARAQYDSIVLERSIHRCEGTARVLCPLCENWGNATTPATIAPPSAVRIVGTWWAVAKRNDPACYVTNVTPVVKAKFTMEPASVESATLYASATNSPFGGLLTNTVAFVNGVSSPEYVPMTAQHSTGGAIAKCAYQFEWHVVDTNAAAVPDTLFQTTGTHTNYVIFAEPVAPWSNIYGVSSNAWATALDFTIDNGCNGKTTAADALGAITQYLHSDFGLHYDTMFGKPRYVKYEKQKNSAKKSHMYLSSYIGKGNGNFVNCYDQASAVAVLGNLHGLDANISFLQPFGYINEVKLVGVGNCNNPFYAHPEYSSDPVCSDNNRRSSFLNHRFVNFQNKVFDACAGPDLGTQTEAEYLTTVVDKSSSELLYLPRFSVENGQVEEINHEGRISEIQ